MWRAAGFEVEHSLFQGGKADVGVGLAGFEGVHSGEVSTREGLQSDKDFDLRVSHYFGEAVNDAHLGGGEVSESGGSVFGCRRVHVDWHGEPPIPAL
jgi:hypothetical protein